MNDEPCPPVSVSRTIEAPAQKLFAILADPANHRLIDGSGMVREASSDAAVSAVGDVFTMRMHNDEMGDYEMSNHVVEYELNRRIGWNPLLKAASREEDQAEVGHQEPAQRWTFDLVPLDSGATLVTETYDVSRGPAWLRRAVKGGERWRESMTITLAKLDTLGRSQ
jgi:uncharacterized protein YndB with AHSA1/START domain